MTNQNLIRLKHFLKITKEVGKDLGFSEALRVGMFTHEDEVNMIMSQCLGAIKGMDEQFTLTGWR